MNLAQSIEHREQAIVSRLRSIQLGIDNATGKGDVAEEFVERELLAPYLPPGFRCTKGAIVSTEARDTQSPAIDRIVYDSGLGAPLVLESPHSILPIEIVCGVVEVTVHLDARKLETDMERIAAVRQMRVRRYLEAIPGTQTRARDVQVEGIGVRAYIVGLPADPAWSPHSIAHTLKHCQKRCPPGMHLHGAYLPGIGFFETITVERGQPQPYDIASWCGRDRMFRFVNEIQLSFARWSYRATNTAMRSAYMNAYLDGAGGIYADDPDKIGPAISSGWSEAKGE